MITRCARGACLTSSASFAARDGGAVLDGRDIGTVICPDADVKLFVTANAEVRAERQVSWSCPAKAYEVTRDQDVLSDVIARDKRDSERAEAPLKPAKDAVIIDTSESVH